MTKNEAIKTGNKKKLITGIIAAVVVVAVASSIIYMKVLKPSQVTTLPPQTITVSKQDVQKTLSATGSIISSEESTALASTTSTYPVAEVYVKIGDVVKAGDPLYKLDMSSTELDLDYQQKAISLQNKKNDLAMASAQTDLDKQMYTGALNVIDSNKGTDDAVKDKEELKNKVTKAEDDYAKAERAADHAYDDMNAAKEAAEAGTGTIEAYENARSRYDGAMSALRTAETALSDAKKAYNDADKKIESASEKAGRTQTQMDYENLAKSRGIQSAELDGQISNLTNKKEVAKTKKELEKAVVYASQDGTVTNVNIKPGQNYNGTDAIVIDNMESLLASADIDEAQIPKITMGQEVEIKTDATGDMVMKGTVTFISPTATKNSDKDKDKSSSTASVSKTRATYRVDVTIEAPDPALRLGMTAKMTFIIDKKDGALVLPSADVLMDEDGNNYVMVMNAEGTGDKVPVTTGISDDYFTEISGDGIKEGTEIVEGSAMDIDSLLNSMGADGGISSGF